MKVTDRFRFDHEEGDTARDTVSLKRFAAMGIELGAEVTVWRCDSCGETFATFDYGDGSA